MDKSKRFGLTGVAGYIAPRHLKAIQEVGGQLVAALDPHSSVGILDRFGFWDSAFFTSPEQFENHLSKLEAAGEGINYLSVASPNFLHHTHARMGMNNGADIICEKPLVIKSRNLDRLLLLEQKTGRRIYTVLQLRHHPVILGLRDKASIGYHHVNLDYATPRGVWYHYTWKEDPDRSGGLIVNIGIHFLDMLMWLFGPCTEVFIKEQTNETVSGVLQLERAIVTFRLTIRRGEGRRLITIDGEPLDFTTGFDSLHTEVYRSILSGDGFGVESARPSIELAEKIRNFR